MPRHLTIAASLVMLGTSSTLAAGVQAQPGQQVRLSSSIFNQANLPMRALAVHNRYRAQVGVQPLLWDARLEAGALLYARQLAATGTFAHSVRATRPGQGENLWMGTAGSYSLETMLTHWGEERNQFRAGIFPNVVRSGSWQDIAHYSQMIWRGTTHVGCALHSGRGADYLVCRYSPAGNRDGQRVP
jgi:hypothetical protein